MPRWLKWVLIVLGGVAALAVVVSFVRDPDDGDRKSITFSEMIETGRGGDIERIEVRGSSLDITLTGEREEWHSRMGLETDLVAALEAEDIAVGGADGVEVDFGSSSLGLHWASSVIGFVPFILFVTILYFTLRNAVREGIRRGDRDAGR